MSAQRVVREASCPVLVVPPAAEPTSVLPRIHARPLLDLGTSREYAPLLTDGERTQIAALRPTESYDEILQAASEATPDLIVCDRECAALGTLVRKATVPVLSVSASHATQHRDHQAEEHVR